MVKRADGDRGSRYLLELEVEDANSQLLRLSQYVYRSDKPTLLKPNGSSQATEPLNKPVLCNPVGLEWNPAAMVHIILAGTSRRLCVVFLTFCAANFFFFFLNEE